MDTHSKAPDRIQCPKCGEAIDLPALLRSQVEAGLKAQIEAAYAKKAAEDVERAKKDAKLLHERESREAEEMLRARDQELATFRKKLGDAAKREEDFLQRVRDLELKEQEAGLALQKRLAEELPKLQEQAEKMASERAALDAAEAQRQRDEEHRQQILGLQRTIEDLRRKAQQGSEQIQGEAQEVLLRDLLARAFPRDEVEDVAKGVTGADLQQRVRDNAGSDCGTILWESKRTKSWEEKWLPKLRDDMRAVGAAEAIIVSKTLPADIRHFGQKDGVWVCSWEAAAPLAGVVRAALVEIAAARRSAEGRSDKVGLLYSYLTGPEFKNHIDGVAEAFKTMTDDLADEMTKMQVLWKKRSKQIERARANLTAFYGTVRGIGGGSIMEVKALEFLTPEALGSPAAAETPALPNEPKAD